MGRTARGENKEGQALLILRPEEAGFLNYLRHARVTLAEYDFNWEKTKNVQEDVSHDTLLIMEVSQLLQSKSTLVSC